MVHLAACSGAAGVVFQESRSMDSTNPSGCAGNRADMHQTAAISILVYSVPSSRRLSTISIACWHNGSSYVFRTYTSHLGIGQFILAY